MNKYLIGVEGYFIGTDTFEIEAEDRKEALSKARVRLEMRYSYGYKLNTLHVIKKLRK